MSDFVTKTPEREKKGMQLSAIVNVVKMFQMNFLTFRAFCLEKNNNTKTIVKITRMFLCTMMS